MLGKSFQELSDGMIQQDRGWNALCANIVHFMEHRITIAKDDCRPIVTALKEHADRNTSVERDQHDDYAWVLAESIAKQLD